MTYDDPIPELKRELAAQLVTVLDGWPVGFAGSMIGADKWRVDDLRAGRLRRFSLETLIRFAARAQCKVGVTFERPGS